MTRSLRQPGALLLLACATVVLLGGCQSNSWQSASFESPSAAGARRSIALNSPRLHRLEQAQANAGEFDEFPWYSYRRDFVPATYDGVQSPTYDQSVTWTYDNQSSSGGRVYDYFNSTTYRSSTISTVH